MNKQQRETSLVRTAQLAIRAARKCVAPYGSIKSRKDFTQPQLVACLVLKAATRNDYRGVCELLTLSPALREAIGLRKVPHFTTLQKFAARPGALEIVDAMIGQVVKEAGLAEDPGDVAVDSTGMQSGVASLHYRTRQYRPDGTRRKPVKVSTAVVCGALIPLALVVDVGASADMAQMPALMEQIESRATPKRLLADKGYDAEWVHEVCRERWGAESLIPPVTRTPDGTIKTKWRKQMRDLPAVFGRRWHVESFFSGLKRTTLSTLSSRTERTLVSEAAFKVLAYAIRR